MKRERTIINRVINTFKRADGKEGGLNFSPPPFMVTRDSLEGFFSVETIFFFIPNSNGIHVDL